MGKVNYSQMGEGLTLPGYVASLRRSPPSVLSDAASPHFYAQIRSGVEGCCTCGVVRFMQNGKFVYDLQNGDRIHGEPAVCQAEFRL